MFIFAPSASKGVREVSCQYFLDKQSTVTHSSSEIYVWIERQQYMERQEPGFILFLIPLGPRWAASSSSGADASSNWKNLSWGQGWLWVGGLGFRGICPLGPMLLRKSGNLGLRLKLGPSWGQAGLGCLKCCGFNFPLGGSCRCCVCPGAGAGASDGRGCVCRGWGGLQRTAGKTDHCCLGPGLKPTTPQSWAPGPAISMPPPTLTRYQFTAVSQRTEDFVSQNLLLP